MLKRFNKVFGIHDSVDIERKRFVNRINQTLFPRIQELKYPDTYESIFAGICYLLGENSNDLIAEFNRRSHRYETLVPPLRRLTGDDFFSTIKILGFLYHLFEKQEKEKVSVENSITTALSYATIDLGVRWSNGMFFPSGAESLDAALIDDAWKWLQDYPREQKDFMTAIGHFVSKNYGDSISNSYLVAEGLARTILQNSKTLDNNKEELLRVCKLSREWKSFLSNYFDYANTYKRHASEKRGDINPIEAEAFLYFTGIIVRLLIESTKTT